MRVSNAFNVRRLGFVAPSNELALPTRHVGIEIEVENAPNSIPRQGVWHGWDIHRDNSLRNAGLEFVTPPSYGEEVLRLVHDFCREAQQAGMVASVRTGTHIHVNVSDNDVDTLRYIVSIYSIFEPALFRMVGEWRRWSNFCYSLNDADGIVRPLRSLFTAKTERALRQSTAELEPLRYTAINLASLAKYGTIEFRLFPTSFNPDELLLWVNLVLLIVGYGEELYASKTSPLKHLEEVGIHTLTERVFGKSSGCLSAMNAFVKDRDGVTCRGFLLSCNDVTAKLLSACIISDEENDTPTIEVDASKEAEMYLRDPLRYILGGGAVAAVGKKKIDLATNPAIVRFLEKHKSKKKPRPAAPAKQKQAPSNRIDRTLSGEVAGPAMISWDLGGDTDTRALDNATNDLATFTINTTRGIR